MEFSLSDEDLLIEIINDQKALKHEVKHIKKNIDEIPVYKNCFDKMKNENGENVLNTIV